MFLLNVVRNFAESKIYNVIDYEFTKRNLIPFVRLRKVVNGNDTGISTTLLRLLLCKYCIVTLL